VDLSPASIAFGIVFGCFGFATLQVGRKRAEPRKIVIGVVLLGLTFVVGGVWWAWILAVVGLVAAWA
jgi:hypothetical protein